MVHADPKVTVMMAVYNVARYLRAALDSVLAEDFADYEIVAVNDGSTDDSPEILEHYAARHAHLRVIHQQNQGIAATRNRMVNQARGEYLAVLDPDDLQVVGRLKRQSDHLDQHPDCVLVGGQILDIAEDGRPLAVVGNLPTDPHCIAKGFAAGHYRRRLLVAHPASMFRRDAALQVGNYAPRMGNMGEDMDLFSRLLRVGWATNLPDVVLARRLRPDSACSRLEGLSRREAAQLHRQTAGPVAAEVPAAEPVKASDRADTRRALSPRAAQANYLCRLGRAALRGRRWGLARHYYATSIGCRPMQWLAYTGLLRAWLHLGGLPHPSPDQLALLNQWELRYRSGQTNPAKAEEIPC